MSVRNPGRPRRERSATESLLAIVLVLEAIVVFFVALTVFGLDLLPPWLALGGGVALILVLALDARLVHRSAGVWLGWLLQLGLILLGLVTPVMWFIGAGFAGLWVFCFLKGRQLDRARAAHLAASAGRPDASEPANASDPSPPPNPSPRSKETK